MIQKSLGRRYQIMCPNCAHPKEGKPLRENYLHSFLLLFLLAFVMIVVDIKKGGSDEIHNIDEAYCHLFNN